MMSKFQFHGSGELSVSKQKYIVMAICCYHINSPKQVNIFNLSFTSIFFNKYLFSSYFPSDFLDVQAEQDEVNGMNRNRNFR